MKPIPTWQEVTKTNIWHVEAMQKEIDALRTRLAELERDAAMLDFMQVNLMRKSSMRFSDWATGDVSFKEVNAWAVSSSGTNLRDVLTALMASAPKGEANHE